MSSVHVHQQERGRLARNGIYRKWMCRRTREAVKILNRKDRKGRKAQDNILERDEKK
jgi:hypothetical protein